MPNCVEVIKAITRVTVGICGEILLQTKQNKNNKNTFSVQTTASFPTSAVSAADQVKALGHISISLK